MKKLADESRHDNDLGMDYRYTKWEINGHIVEVTQDARGVHPRLNGDNKTIEGNLDAEGLRAWLMRKLGRR